MNVEVKCMHFCNSFECFTSDDLSIKKSNLILCTEDLVAGDINS